MIYILQTLFLIGAVNHLSMANGRTSYINFSSEKHINMVSPYFSMVNLKILNCTTIICNNKHSMATILIDLFNYQLFTIYNMYWYLQKCLFISIVHSKLLGFIKKLLYIHL